MNISSYQINTVLKIYNQQLKTEPKRNQSEETDEGRSVEDRVSISSEGKKKQVVEKIAMDIIERITKR